MKTCIPILFATFAGASFAFAQSPTPSASAEKPAAGATSARTEVYHVMFVKSALGKAAEEADSVKKPDPTSPMPGHKLILRHQEGDGWDYVVIEHLGTKATVDAARPAMPAAQRALSDWHNDTYVAGPSWSDLTKQMGLDDPSKSAGSVYVVSVYRPAPGQREGLDKMLSEPPDRAVDTSSGTVLMQHLDGSEWSFLAVARYNSWAEFGTNEMNSVAQTNKNQGGWFQLRTLVAAHTDTVCDRIMP